MTARISPMDCIPRIRFFFIDIFKNLLYCGRNKSGINPVQILAMLFQILQHLLIGHICFHVSYLQKLSMVHYLYYLATVRAVCDRYQKRSERIRLLPYSSIALTRSCFMEIFFMAIPPKKVARINRNEIFIFKTCRFALPLALAWRYYSTRFSRKKVAKLTSDG